LIYLVAYFLNNESLPWSEPKKFGLNLDYATIKEVVDLRRKYMKKFDIEFLSMLPK
jgi:hypothetical protein